MAAPTPLRTMRGMGQPKLMSTTSAPAASTDSASFAHASAAVAHDLNAKRHTAGLDDRARDLFLAPSELP